MKFIDPKTKNIYQIMHEAGEWKVAIENEDKDLFDYADDFNPQEEEGKAFENLIIYARDKGLIPLFVYEKNKVEGPTLQGTPGKHKVARALPQDRLLKTCQEYISYSEESEQLQADQNTEIKSLKTTYQNKINDIDKIMKELKPVVTSGDEMVETEASWERYAKMGLMVLVECATLQVIKVKPMEPHEQEPDVFDGEDETKTASDETNIPEPETEENTDEKEQADSVQT